MRDQGWSNFPISLHKLRQQVVLNPSITLSVHMAFQIFVSHSVSPEDNLVLAELEKTCRALGIGLYVAERDPQPGTQLSLKVREGISHADLVLVLLTQGGAASAWVNQEIGLAASLQKQIVPLLEEGVEPPGLVAELEYVRFHRERSGDAFNRLTEFLARKKTDKEFWTAVAVIVGVAAAVLFALLLLGSED